MAFRKPRTPEKIARDLEAMRDNIGRLCDCPLCIARTAERFIRHGEPLIALHVMALEANPIR